MTLKKSRSAVEDPPSSGGAEPAVLRGAARSLRPYSALALLGLVPLLVLAVFAYLISARAVESLVERGNDAAALITAALVEREFEHWGATVTSHASAPAFASAVASGAEGNVRRRLEVFVTAHPQLDRAFVTDPSGLLWADFPIARESLGRRFDDRDWYRGVTRAGSRYVSEVYRRNAEPKVQVVAVAAPVTDPESGELAGLLVGQIRLDDLTDLLRRVEVGREGAVLLRDHTGSLAAHPFLDLPNRASDEYAEVRLPSGQDPAGVRHGRYTDPVTGRTMLASSSPARLGEHEWTVISQQAVAVALAPIRDLAYRLGAAGVLMALLTGGLLWGLLRETARRREAEGDLVALNEDLERRVEERTAALREREDQLLQVQKMEAVGRLAGGVAHDFNNLLTVILGSSEFLRLRVPEQAPERREVEAVRQAAERGAELTGQLLAFSRKQVMQPKVLDVNESLERIRGILERVLREDVGLIWNLRPGLHPVKFDPGQVEQVVLNLVVNARDAMPRGGKLTIETANVELDEQYAEEHVDARVGPHVMLAVSDTGVGMDAEVRQKIFEPFYTSKGLGQGTGLGLATVYGIVQQGGGNIWVYSEPGKGTTFKIYLPRTEDVERHVQEVPQKVEEVSTGTLLVVEDDESVRVLLVRILAEAGYDVVEAENTEAAVEAFRSHANGIDLLLTDVILPDGGGRELAGTLAAEQEDLRILYMSGYTDNAIVHHGVLDEGIAFLEKPFRPQVLLATVRKELARPAP